MSSPSTGAEHRFTAEVLAAGNGGHAVVVPKEVAAGFSGKRVAVVAQVDGVEYRSRLAVYGGTSYLGLRKDLLKQLGRRAGDTVAISLVEGAAAPEPTEPAAPAPTEPPELLEALATNEPARTAYAVLPPGHRREYWAWIAAAETAPARADRVARTLRNLTR